MQTDFVKAWTKLQNNMHDNGKLWILNMDSQLHL